MDDYLYVRMYEVLIWPVAPKDEVLVHPDSRDTAFRIFTEVDGLWLEVGIIRGPRGGIKEYFILIDPSETIIGDRLRARGTASYGADFQLLNASEIRQACREGDPEAACRAALDELVAKLKADPDWGSRRLRHLRSPSESVPTFTGGLPSLGKNGTA